MAGARSRSEPRCRPALAARPCWRCCCSYAAPPRARGGCANRKGRSELRGAPSSQPQVVRAEKARLPAGSSAAPSTSVSDCGGLWSFGSALAWHFGVERTPIAISAPARSGCLVGAHARPHARGSLGSAPQTPVREASLHFALVESG